MIYALGVTIFAVGILVSVCLHEAGHLVTAKRFGMNATHAEPGEIRVGDDVVVTLVR